MCCSCLAGCANGMHGAGSEGTPLRGRAEGAPDSWPWCSLPSLLGHAIAMLLFSFSFFFLFIALLRKCCIGASVQR